MNAGTGAGMALAALAVAGAALAQGAGSRTWDFQGDLANGPPAGFSFGRTGKGRPGKWVVLVDATAPAGDHVLAQVDADDTDYRFPVAVADAPVLGDPRAEVRCKQVSGRNDQACGLVFRYQDENDYYVARANALEDNVRLYHVVKGRRLQIGGWSGKVAGGVWHALAIEARGDRLAVLWEGRPIIDVVDGTLRQAGKVGLWTKADSVTYFGAFSATPLF
jgi:hypothetical protein